MLIALVGIDGAGKTTQALLLQSALAAQGLRATIIDMWSLLSADRHPECRFLSGDRPQLRTCISEMNGAGRALFLFWMHALASEYSLQEGADVVIADGYWYKHAAAELAYGCPEPLIESAGTAFRRPDLSLFLDLTPERALMRKGIRGLTPYECGRDPDMAPENFLSHQARVYARLRAWAPELGWRRIDADRPGESLHQAIWEEVEHARRFRSAPAA